MATAPTLPGRPQAAEHTAALMSNVNKNYGAVQALKNFNLEVQAGELTAVLGPNGAGKTTAITVLLGLGRPDAGSIEVFGMEPDAAVARGLVGAMLQDGGMMPASR